MKATPLINRFNSGELSDDADTRADKSRYYSGCRTLQNMVPLPEGPVMRMPGSYYVRPSRTTEEGPVPPYPPTPPPPPWKPGVFYAVSTRVPENPAAPNILSWDGATLAYEDGWTEVYDAGLNFNLDATFFVFTQTAGVVLVCSWNKDARTLAYVHHITPGYRCGMVRFTPLGNDFIAGLSFDNKLFVLSFDGSTLAPVDDIDTYQMDSIAWSPDAAFIAVASRTNSLNIYSWDGSTLALVKTGGVICHGVAWHPDGTHIAISYDTGSVQVYAYTSGTNTLTGICSHVSGGYHCAWSPDGLYLAVVKTGSGGYLKVFSFDGASLTLVGTANYPAGRRVAFGGTNNRIWTCINDGGVYKHALFDFNGTSLTLLDTHLALATYNEDADIY